MNQVQVLTLLVFAFFLAFVLFLVLYLRTKGQLMRNEDRVEAITERFNELYPQQQQQGGGQGEPVMMDTYQARRPLAAEMPADVSRRPQERFVAAFRQKEPMMQETRQERMIARVRQKEPLVLQEGVSDRQTMGKMSIPVQQSEFKPVKTLRCPSCYSKRVSRGLVVKTDKGMEQVLKCEHCRSEWKMFQEI